MLHPSQFLSAAITGSQLTHMELFSGKSWHCASARDATLSGPMTGVSPFQCGIIRSKCFNKTATACADIMNQELIGGQPPMASSHANVPLAPGSIRRRSKARIAFRFGSVHWDTHANQTVMRFPCRGDFDSIPSDTWSGLFAVKTQLDPAAGTRSLDVRCLATAAKRFACQTGSFCRTVRC